MKLLLLLTLLLPLRCGIDDIYSLVKEASKETVTYYNYGQKREYKSNNFIKPKWKRISKELEKDGFVFNPQADTVIIYLDYSLMLARYFSFSFRHGFIRYYAAPIVIECYSSLGESHLSYSMDSRSYERYFLTNTNSSPSIYDKEKEKQLLEMIRNNEKDKIEDICDQFSLYGNDLFPIDHYRVVVKDGKVISSTNWVFFLWIDYYYSDEYKEYLKALEKQK